MNQEPLQIRTRVIGARVLNADVDPSVLLNRRFLILPDGDLKGKYIDRSIFAHQFPHNRIVLMSQKA